MPVSVEFGKFRGNDGRTYPCQAVLSIEVIWVAHSMEEAIRGAVQVAQDEASRFARDGQCLTQQLAAEKRKVGIAEDGNRKLLEDNRNLRLKLRRLQGQLRKAQKAEVSEDG